VVINPFRTNKEPGNSASNIGWPTPGKLRAIRSMVWLDQLQADNCTVCRRFARKAPILSAGIKSLWLGR
jgi:hypothetical protein